MHDKSVAGVVDSQLGWGCIVQQSGWVGDGLWTQPLAVKLLLCRHWMHELQVHPLTPENQFHCTRLYNEWCTNLDGRVRTHHHAPSKQLPEARVREFGLWENGCHTESVPTCRLATAKEHSWAFSWLIDVSVSECIAWPSLKNCSTDGDASPSLISLHTLECSVCTVPFGYLQKWTNKRCNRKVNLSI